MAETKKRSSGSHTLIEAIRDASKHAIRRGILDSNKQAEFIHSEISAWLSPINIKMMILYYIKTWAVAKPPKIKETPEDEPRFRFFDALDETYAVKRPAIQNEKTGEEIAPARTDFVPLGDFGLVEVAQRDVQMRQNINDAINAQNEWNWAKGYVVPLLNVHKKWTWRDAVEHLRSAGRLPDGMPE